MQKGEPMNDLIYRQSAINALENTECELLAEEWDELTNAIKQVPSADPKKGQWEEKSVFEGEIQQWQSARCSVCNKYHTTPYLYYFDNFKYCPNCGASMGMTK